MRFQNPITVAPRLQFANCFWIQSVAVLLVLSSFAMTFPGSAAAQSMTRAPFGQSRIARAMSRVAPVESENFIVYANDAILAQKVSQEAERFRRELSIKWLGKEIPRWQGKCPITVELGRNAGGETSFAFIQGRNGVGQPIDWKMKIFGPPDRLLDAVLPHEVTHTIFATHFGSPLPRWADEGACTTVEHESERQKNHYMLMDFLTSQPSRGIPFNRMFTMRNYPHDILPLYAQGHSLARFLIMKKGHRKFIDYIGRGLQYEKRSEPLRAWDQATDEFYNYKNLSDLQVDWLKWVKAGSRESLDSANPNERMAIAATNPQESFTSTNSKSVYQDFSKSSSNDLSSNRNKLAANDSTQNGASGFRPVEPLTFSNDKAARSKAELNSGIPATYTSSNSDSTSGNGSWYIREMNKGQQKDQSTRVAGSTLLSNQTRKVPSAGGPSSPPPVEHDSRLPRKYQTVPSTLWR